jgi:hypothetical protein
MPSFVVLRAVRHVDIVDNTGRAPTSSSDGRVVPPALGLTPGSRYGPVDVCSASCDEVDASAVEVIAAADNDQPAGADAGGEEGVCLQLGNGQCGLRTHHVVDQISGLPDGDVVGGTQGVDDGLDVPRSLAAVVLNGFDGGGYGAAT